MQQNKSVVGPLENLGDKLMFANSHQEPASHKPDSVLSVDVMEDLGRTPPLSTDPLWQARVCGTHMHRHTLTHFPLRKLKKKKKAYRKFPRRNCHPFISKGKHRKLTKLRSQMRSRKRNRWIWMREHQGFSVGRGGNGRWEPWRKHAVHECFVSPWFEPEASRSPACLRTETWGSCTPTVAKRMHRIRL